MKTPVQFDDDGYPTQGTLDTIAGWKHTENYFDLMEYIIEAWNWGTSMTSQDGREFELHTGGWSGNEDIIASMQNNHIFWAMCWVSSRRGGHYTFEVRRKDV